MAGTPVAFQPNACQNDAFQTGIPWGYEYQIIPPRMRYQAAQAIASQSDQFPAVKVAGASGWENTNPSLYRSPVLKTVYQDVLPADLRAGTGWEAIMPRPWAKPWLPASAVEIYPYPIVPFDWGFETVDPRPYRIPWLQATTPDVLPADLRAGL